MPLKVICCLEKIVTQSIENNALGGRRPPKVIVILLLVAHFVPHEGPGGAALEEDALHQARIVSGKYLVLVNGNLRSGKGVCEGRNLQMIEG